MFACSLPTNSSMIINGTLLDELNIDELQAMRLLIQQLVVDSYQTPSYPCIKPHFRSMWPFFVLLYSLVSVLGASGNVYMMFLMFSETNFRRFVNYLLLNLCVCDILKCTVILPLTLCVFLTKHWFFGATMCHMFPVLQTFPVVVSMLTYLLIALNRYFLVFHSSNRTLGKNVYIFLMAAVWIPCACLSMPLKSYMRYFDLGVYLGDALRGQGMCVVRFSSDIREMNTALFVAFFIIPVVLMAYLFVKSNGELKRQLNASAAPTSSGGAAGVVEQTAAKLATTTMAESRDEYKYLKVTPSHSFDPMNISVSDAPPNSRSNNSNNRSNSFLCYIDQERMHISLLIKFNQCLTVMIMLFALCWAPLQCLMLITYVIVEGADTLVTVDSFFVFFTLIGFVSTITNPGLLLYQKRSLQTTLQSGIRILRRFSSTSEHRKRSPVKLSSLEEE